MFGSDIALKQQFAEARFRDFLAEAERQRAANMAINGRPRRARIAEARAAIATAFLRAGSWLMPEEAPNRCGNPANCGFELRPGQ
ncbi:MAG: hypothetical protein ACRDJC_22515 [Thermomicrobiales bacterium]